MKTRQYLLEALSTFGVNRKPHEVQTMDIPVYDGRIVLRMESTGELTVRYIMNNRQERTLTLTDKQWWPGKDPDGTAEMILKLLGTSSDFDFDSYVVNAMNDDGFSRMADDILTCFRNHGLALDQDLELEDDDTYTFDANGFNIRIHHRVEVWSVMEFVVSRNEDSARMFYTYFHDTQVRTMLPGVVDSLMEVAG